MENLLELLKARHLAFPPATEADIARFERRVGWKLDDQLKTFYLACNGARLFSENDSPYYFLPLEKLERTRSAVYGREAEEYGPDSWWAIIDVQDGNYLAVNVATTGNGPYPIRDIFHEAADEPKYCQIICPDFQTLLRRALESEGRHFWLGDTRDCSLPLLDPN